MKTLKDIERRLAESVLARDAVQPLFDEPPNGVLGDLDRHPEPGRTSGFYAVPERAVPGRPRVAGGNARSAGDAGAFLGRAAGAVPPTVDRTSVLINRCKGKRRPAGPSPGRLRSWRHDCCGARTDCRAATCSLTSGAPGPRACRTVQARSSRLPEPGCDGRAQPVELRVCEGHAADPWVFALLASPAIRSSPTRKAAGWGSSRSLRPRAERSPGR